MKTTLLAGAATIVLAAMLTTPLAGGPARAEDAPQGLMERDTLTGDWGGLRTRLIDNGLTLGLKYTGELWGVSGGIHNGVDYYDSFLATADFDFEKMVGLTGGSAHVSGLTFQGRGPSFNDVGNAMTVSGTESIGRNQRYTRLWTLWYQQAFLDNKVSVRFGQLSADDEFNISPTAGGLINATFAGGNLAWFANLPGGIPNSQGLANGPVYPLGAPGVRLALAPTENIQWLTAAFTHQPESPDRGGAQFKFDGEALVITEFGYLLNQAKDATGKPAMYKLGAWYDTGSYNDPRYDVRGLPLAATSGVPRRHDGSWSVYGLIDQTVWQGPEGQAVSLFLRGQLAPEYNAVSKYVDGGVGYKGLFAGRRSDTLTLGVAYGQVGDRVSGFDRDLRTVNRVNSPIRDSEIAIELSYLAPLAPWWTIQPDFQYIINPNFGNVNSNPNSNPGLNPTKTIKDAAVFGLRTTITF